MYIYKVRNIAMYRHLRLDAKHKCQIKISVKYRYVVLMLTSKDGINYMYVEKVYNGFSYL